MQQRERFVETNGIRMKMAEVGSGIDLVFIHGLGWDHTLWSDAFVHYGDRYHVVAGDTRGHGESDKPTGPYSIRQFADDWLGALDELEIEKACLVGFSQGGMIAMHLALDEPERFIGMILASTVCRTDIAGGGASSDRVAKLRDEGAEESARNSAELIFSQNFIKQHPDYINSFVAKRAAFPPETLVAAMEAGSGFNLCDRLSTYKNPCMIMAGSVDALTKPDAVGRVAESMPGSQFVTVEGAGHMVPAEQPSVFYSHIDRFLADHIAPAVASA